MSKSLLLIGSNGALGRQIVSQFKNASWVITSVDFTINQEANFGIQLTPGLSTKQTMNLIEEKMQLYALLEAGLVSYIVSYVGGNLLDDNLFDNVDLMVNQSVSSSVIASKLAALHLKTGGLLVLTGAAACLHGTPSMIAYGMAKAAVHHLIRSSAGPDSGMPASSAIVGICPVTLDTPMNRKYMPDADVSTWTPLPEISQRLVNWANESEPIQSGKLYKIVTENSQTSWQPE